MTKSADAFRTISEVADDLGIPKHVLRFWEVKFTHIRPMKRGGGRRYYRPEDMELLRGIRHLLHREGYTIKGVQKILREQGVDAVKQHSQVSTVVLPASAGDLPANAGAATKSVSGMSEASAAHRLPQAEPPGRRGRAPQKAPARKLATDVIRGAIVELERCRAMLKGEAVAEPIPERRATGTR